MESGSLCINRYSIFGFAAILLWSTTIALARSLSEQIGPLTAGACVYLAGGAVCAGILFSGGNPVPRLLRIPGRYLLGCGSLFALYTVAIYAAIGMAGNREETVEIGLINYLWPAAIILFSLPILHKRAGVFLLPATATALAGVFFVLTQGASISWGSFVANVVQNPWACLLALIAALTWGVYSNLVRRWLGEEGENTVPFFMLATGVILLMLRWVFAEAGVWRMGAFAEIAVLTAAASGGYIFWDIAMRRGNLVLVAAVSYLTPLLSTLITCVYLGVAAGVQLWLGCVLIVIGSFFSWLSVSDDRHEHGEAGWRHGNQEIPR